MFWDLSDSELEAVDAAVAALVEAHLAHPDLAQAIAVCALRAGSPKLWLRLQRRIDHLEDELGWPRSLSG